MTSIPQPTTPSSAAHAEPLKLWHGVLVFVIVMACNLWGLGDSPLARTEPHRALTGHAMVESGDWLLPRLLGVLYLRKPPLSYWAIAATETIVGHGDEFVWRLPGAISSAMLAVFLWYIGFKWFGRVGGWVSAFSFLAMLALWSQSRSAEIDSLNTTAAVVCALAMIQLQCGPPGRAWLWSGVVGVSLGATLLAKGPAGLPLIGGAILGPMLLLRQGRQLAKPSLWVGVAIGFGIFAAWVFAVYLAVKSQNLSPDLSGLSEVKERVSADSVLKLLRATTIPFELLAYGLPATAALPVAWMMIRRGPDTTQRRLLAACVGTAIASLLIFGLSMIMRPRYGYPALPLWCPVAGAVAAAWARGELDRSTQTLLRAALTGLTIMLAVLHYALIFGLSPLDMTGSWHGADSSLRAWLIGTCIVAALAWVVTMVMWIRQRVSPAAWGMVVLCVTLSIAFNAFKNADRSNRSGYESADEVRQAIDNSDTVLAGMLIMNQPELFYYAKLNVVPVAWRTDGWDTLDKTGWALFDPKEWRELSPAVRQRLSRETPLVTRGKGLAPGKSAEEMESRPTAYVAWHTPVSQADPK
jgi:4-amino-4-deoxy-L-arabinose transferase-like glycosyltransferase